MEESQVNNNGENVNCFVETEPWHPGPARGGRASGLICTPGQGAE